MTASDDAIWRVGVSEQDGERTFQAGEHAEGGGFKVALGGTLVVGQCEEVCCHLGVRFGFHFHAGCFDFVTEGGEVFNDAVVDDGCLAVERTMRVRVGIVGSAVRGPTRVADAGRALESILADFVETVQEVIELALFLFEVQLSGFDDCNSCRIVPSVFHSFEGIEADLQRI